MSKSPFFSNEVNLNKVNFSNINYSNNKEYFCISYDKDNQNLYLQLMNVLMETVYNI